MEMTQWRWLMVFVLCGCPQPIGNRCGPELPPCPSGTACVEATCQEVGAAGGRAGVDAGGSAGGQQGGGGGSSVGGGSVAGGSVAGGEAGGAGGGTGGGLGGGVAGGVPGCSPGCGSFEECSGTTCLPRYSGIAVVAPGRTNRPVPVSASLVQIGGRLGNPPLTLEVEALLSGSMPVRVGDPMQLLSDGGYALTNPLPVPREGTWSITVSWPDAGLSGTAQTIVDLTGPALTLTWPVAPAFGFDGGLDARDPFDPPMGPFSWRHSSTIPVRIESGSTDLVESSVRVSLGGAAFTGALTPCVPDGGPTDSGSPDGGFCRIARVPLRLGVLENLRGTIPVIASASDDLTNEMVADAGAIAVTRWVFSLDAGSGQNGFSLGLRDLVVPSTPNQSVQTWRLSNGRRSGSYTLRYPPVRNVAIGQESDFIFTLEYKDSTGLSSGEAITSTASFIDWATSAIRPGIQLTGPILSLTGTVESVGAVSRMGASWAVFGSGALVVAAESSGPISSSGTMLAVANGPMIIATDTSSLFVFSGASNSFEGVSPAPGPTVPTPFAAISHLIGVDGGVAGFGAGSGSSLSFFATTTAFSSWAPQAAEAFSPPVAGGGFLYFLRLYGSFSVVCRGGSASGSFVCAQANLQDQTSGLALGAGDTLYTVVTRAPANTSLLQVRTASTLALRYEIPLPRVTGACLSLTPTCIAGNPVIGCVDTVGQIVFVSTDARGIDTTADWPMEGHDPGKTFNTATDLSRYACP